MRRRGRVDEASGCNPFNAGSSPAVVSTSQIAKAWTSGRTARILSPLAQRPPQVRLLPGPPASAPSGLRLGKPTFACTTSQLKRRGGGCRAVAHSAEAGAIECKLRYASARRPRCRRGERDSISLRSATSLACSLAWQSARFGSGRPQVRILPRRPVPHL